MYHAEVAGCEYLSQRSTASRQDSSANLESRCGSCATVRSVTKEREAQSARRRTAKKFPTRTGRSQWLGKQTARHRAEGLMHVICRQYGSFKWVYLWNGARRCSAGLGRCIRQLVHRGVSLEAGALGQGLRFGLVSEGLQAHFLVCPARRLERREVARFIEWVRAHAPDPETYSLPSGGTFSQLRRARFEPEQCRGRRVTLDPLPRHAAAWSVTLRQLLCHDRVQTKRQSSPKRIACRTLTLAAVAIGASPSGRL